MPHSKPVSAATAYDLRNQMQASSLPMGTDLDVDIPSEMDCLKKVALLGHKDAQAEFKWFCSGLGTTAGAHGVPIDIVKKWLILECL